MIFLPTINFTTPWHEGLSVCDTPSLLWMVSGSGNDSMALNRGVWWMQYLLVRIGDSWHPLLVLQPSGKPEYSIYPASVAPHTSSVLTVTIQDKNFITAWKVAFAFYTSECNVAMCDPIIMCHGCTCDTSMHVHKCMCDNCIYTSQVLSNVVSLQCWGSSKETKLTFIAIGERLVVWGSHFL